MAPERSSSISVHPPVVWDIWYDNSDATVIDPLRAFINRYLEDADDLGVELKYTLDTHLHADHVSDICDLDAEGVDKAFRGVVCLEINDVVAIRSD